MADVAARGRRLGADRLPRRERAEQRRRRRPRSQRARGDEPSSAIARTAPPARCKTGRFHSIGVIMFTLSTFGNMRTLDAIATVAAQAGYSITLIPIARRPSADCLGRLHSRLDASRPSTASSSSSRSHILDRADIALPTGLPVVVIDSERRDTYAVVDTDQAQGRATRPEHLLDLGHRDRLAHRRPPTSYSAARRRGAWLQTLDARPASTPRPRRRRLDDDFGLRSTASPRGAPRRHRRVRRQRPDGTRGSCAPSTRAGSPFPSDISVVGFDDMEESSSFWPPLTTVHQDFSAVGRLCIERLLTQIDGSRPSGGATIVPTVLIERQSTARPRPTCS